MNYYDYDPTLRRQTWPFLVPPPPFWPCDVLSIGHSLPRQNYKSCLEFGGGGLPPLSNTLKQDMITLIKAKFDVDIRDWEIGKLRFLK